MVEISNFRQGAILNYNHGRELADELQITVEGISNAGYPVKVNGVRAVMDGRRFSADIALKQKINTVRAESVTPYGTFAQEIVLVWDKRSFKRCNYYIDDHSFLFTDLAKEQPKSAFDHFYLKGLKEIHKKFGFKVTLNSFYRNDHHGFELKDMPDKWKSEFIDNSDWLKFSFHGYSEFPDRPYLESTAEEFGKHWDMVENEIVRFAGRESFTLPVVMHWANIHPAVGQEMIERGITCYMGCMRPRVMGGPSLADRQNGGNMQQIQSRSISGADKLRGTEAMDLHYGFIEEDDYLKKHDVYFDPGLGICFFRCNAGCSNLLPLEQIKDIIGEELEKSARSGNEIFCGGGHEQYTFPYYPNYLPDHLQRIEEVIRCLSEEGNCKMVFFNDGLLGNTAWED